MQNERSFSLPESVPWPKVTVTPVIAESPLPATPISQAKPETVGVTQSTQLAAAVFFLFSLFLLGVCGWLLWRIGGLTKEVKELRAIESQRRLAQTSPNQPAASVQVVSIATAATTVSETETATPTPTLAAQLPDSWVQFIFPDLHLTLSAPPTYRSDATLSQNTDYVIRFWQGSSASAAKITLTIKPNWDTLAEFKDAPRTVKIGNDMLATKIDPPAKDQQVQDHYQTRYLFTSHAKVYDFVCVHDWQTSLMEQCDTMIKTIKVGG